MSQTKYGIPTYASIFIRTKGDVSMSARMQSPSQRVAQLLERACRGNRTAQVVVIGSIGLCAVIALVPLAVIAMGLASSASVEALHFVRERFSRYAEAIRVNVSRAILAR